MIQDESFNTIDMMNCKDGGLQPKKTEKNEKKPVPNFKFAVAFGFFRFFFRYFSVFFGIFWLFSVFCGTFSVFFGLNFDKKFQHSQIMSTMRSREAKNCLITHFMPIKPCKCLIKAIITNKNNLTKTS